MEVIDEVLVSVMKAPHTYTKEDIVEVNCHGGFLVTQRVLQALLNAGARLAEPVNLQNAASSTGVST